MKPITSHRLSSVAIVDATLVTSALKSRSEVNLDEKSEANLSGRERLNRSVIDL
jgi:hypothetical protein